VGHASSRTSQSISLLGDADASAQLPPFVRPLPSKISPEDVRYLHAKGALSIPCISLQNALLRAYIEFVHPYMPLMDLVPFLSTINRYDGSEGQISLFLYHAVMFSATAFVDMRHLREAGYATRKAARKGFFLKTRVSYHSVTSSASACAHTVLADAETKKETPYSHVNSYSTISITNLTAWFLSKGFC
jgi:hypothetical protein